MILKARVKTNQNKFSAHEVNGILEISTKAPAASNKANLEIVKQLTKLYGGCRIVKGLKSKNKILELGD